MVVIAPHGEVARALPVAWLATHKLLKSVDALVGLELLAATLADKHMATVLSNSVLVRRWQRHVSLVTDITGGEPYISFLCLVPHTDPIQQQHEFPHKLTFDICRCAH